MQYPKFFFDFYIQSSTHVALAVYALVQITNHMFSISYDLPMAMFAFFGTIVGYNFVKYEALVIRERWDIVLKLKFIVLFSICSSILAVYSFFQLQVVTQLVAIIFFIFILLYTVPFLPSKKNIRNWSGVKIYMVSFCWAGITIVLPLLNANLHLSSDVTLEFVQRFLLVIVLILIFEIIDSKNDDPSLQTVPQQIGVYKTKIVGLFLLFLFYLLEFLKIETNINQLLINFAMITVAALFTINATPNRSKYYTLFWVEGIPLFWWGMIVFYE